MLGDMQILYKVWPPSPPARFDNSRIGRFMSPDPLGIFSSNLTDPQTLNLNSYVRNNPVNLTDPSGLDPSDCDPEDDRD
jgi:hypothetical protein